MTKLNENYNKVFSNLKNAGYSIYSYQEEAIKWMIKREITGNVWTNKETNEIIHIKGGLLCDEPGLGKTIECCGMMLGNLRSKTLIIVPTSIIDQWKDAIEKILPNLLIYIHYGSNRCMSIKDLYEKKFDILITTYGMVYNKPRKSKIVDPQTILHYYGKWDRIIVDEVHTIKNTSSKIFKMLNKLKGDIVWGLTGTPIQNSEKDIYGLYKFLNIPKKYLNKSCLEYLNKMLLLRRTKKMVENTNSELKLPKLIEYDHALEYDTESERSVYKKIQNYISKQYDEILEDDELSESLKSIVYFELLLRLRQASIHPQIAIRALSKKLNKKINWCCENSTKIDLLTNMIYESNNKSLIFCHFREEMNLIEESLKKKGILSKQYHGSMNADKRASILASFNSNDSLKVINLLFVKYNFDINIQQKILDNLPKVLIIQINAGGVGINLQQFSEVYFTSADWNPSNEIQAICRAYRIGQKNIVSVHRFILFDQKMEFSTIDQRIASIQLEKREIMSNIFDDDDLLHNGKLIVSKCKDNNLLKQLNMKDYGSLLR